MANGNGNGIEPSNAPQSNRWYNIRLGSSFRDPNSSTKFCTLRYEFQPASIDKTQPGTLHKSKENRVTVEFQNNQHGKPNVTFEGSSEDYYKDNDGVLFFDGETFQLERLHRAVKSLKHVRRTGETTSLAAGPAGANGESHSPPLGKVARTQTVSRPSLHSVPVEVERIDIGEPEIPVPRQANNKSNNTYHQPPPQTNSFSPPFHEQEDEHLDILGDGDPGTPINNPPTHQTTTAFGLDINMPSHQTDSEDEIADVDVNDEEEGLNAAQALLLAVQQGNADTAGGQEGGMETSSSSGGSSSSGSSSGSGSGSGSGSSSSGDSEGSDADAADADSANSGDVDIGF